MLKKAIYTLCLQAVIRKVWIVEYNIYKGCKTRNVYIKEKINYMKKILIIIFIISVVDIDWMPDSLPGLPKKLLEIRCLKLAEKEDRRSGLEIYRLTNPLGFTNELVDGLHVTGNPVKLDIR